MVPVSKHVLIHSSRGCAQDDGDVFCALSVWSHKVVEVHASEERLDPLLDVERIDRKLLLLHERGCEGESNEADEEY